MFHGHNPSTGGGYFTEGWNELNDSTLCGRGERARSEEDQESREEPLPRRIFGDFRTCT